jgi:CoA transferase family III
LLNVPKSEVSTAALAMETSSSALNSAASLFGTNWLSSFNRQKIGFAPNLQKASMSDEPRSAGANCSPSNEPTEVSRRGFMQKSICGVALAGTTVLPRLIYVSISGVGETGPYVKKRVYDPIIQGLSGFADIQSQPVTNRPQMIRTIVCDKTTAIFTAQAVSSALYAREKTGQGDHIQVAMLDAMISYLWPEGMMQYTVVGAEATSTDPNDRPDLVFKTSDGYITAGTILDSAALWRMPSASSGIG